MRCGCGNERPFLVRGVCEVCLPGLAPIKITKHGASRRGVFVVKLSDGVFYGGDKIKNHVVVPVKTSKRGAKIYKSRASVCKVALLYGGTVEEVK